MPSWVGLSASWPGPLSRGERGTPPQQSPRRPYPARAASPGAWRKVSRSSPPRGCPTPRLFGLPSKGKVKAYLGKPGCSAMAWEALGEEESCLDMVLCSLLQVTLLWQGVGLDDPFQPLPTPTIQPLPFCDSVSPPWARGTGAGACHIPTPKVFRKACTMQSSEDLKTSLSTQSQST